MDSPLCLFVVTAWATAHVALLTGSGRWWLVSALACGLGLLTKGPVALVLVGGPVAAWLMLDGRVQRPSCVRSSSLYLLVAGAVAAPWFVLLAIHDPAFLHYFFWFHHVERFLTPFDHQEPFWYFIPVVLLGMLPWSLLLPGLLGWLASRVETEAARRPAGLGFFLLTFIIGFGFFSAAGCKRPAYILVTLPPLALMLGVYIKPCWPGAWAWSARWSGSRRSWPIAWGWRRCCWAWSGAVAAAISGLIAWSSGASHGGSGGAGAWSDWRYRPTADLLGRHGPGRFPGDVRRRAGSAAGLQSSASPTAIRCGRKRWPPDVPVVCYPRRWDSVSFYLQRGDVAECPTWNAWRESWRA